MINFKCEDYYLCKILGCEKNKIYVPTHDGPIWKIAFEKRMFVGIAKMFNVLCYQLQEPNFIEKGVKKFIFLKTPYNF